MKFINNLYNRLAKNRSNMLNKLLNRKHSKINKDFIDYGEYITGLNCEIYMVYKTPYPIENKDEFIDPTKSRAYDRELDERIKKILEKHRTTFERLED